MCSIVKICSERQYLKKELVTNIQLYNNLSLCTQGRNELTAPYVSSVTYSCVIRCTEMVGPCDLVTMVLLTTLVTMPSACRGEMSACALLSERGLMRNLATSTYMHE